MLEARRGETLFGLVTENEVGFREGAVLPKLPGLSYREIAQEVVYRARAKWNRNERIEELARFSEMRRTSRQIKKPEYGKFAKERQVVRKMARQSGQVRFGWLNVREGDHRGRSRTQNEHRKAVHEVAKGRLRGLLSAIGPGGQNVRGNAARLLEIGELFRFSLEVVEVEVRQDEIEHGDAVLDIPDFVFPAV